MTSKESLVILLVEDSDIDAKRIETMLRYSEHADCTLHRAVSLGTALAILRSTMPDVLVMDLGLPDASGISAVTAVTSRYPDLPIVVLTGYGDFASGVHSIQSGAQEYVSKNDITTAALEKAIVHARERKRVTRKHTKLYRNSLVNIAPDATALIDMQHKIQSLTDTLETVRGAITTRAPDVLPVIDAALSAVRDTSVNRGVPVQEKAREVVERLSAVPGGLSTDADPRSILSEVLERYAIANAAGR